jgi:hypothetical protein
MHLPSISYGKSTDTAFMHCDYNIVPLQHTSSYRKRNPRYVYSQLSHVFLLKSGFLLNSGYRISAMTLRSHSTWHNLVFVRYRLQPRELFDAPVSVEATEAAGFGAAVGKCPFVVDGHGVDVYGSVTMVSSLLSLKVTSSCETRNGDLPAFNLLRNAQSTSEILCEDSSAETVVRVVCDLNCFFVAGDFNDGD